jgi:hypothetical protein
MNNNLPLMPVTPFSRTLGLRKTFFKKTEEFLKREFERLHLTAVASGPVAGISEIILSLFRDNKVTHSWLLHYFLLYAIIVLFVAVTALMVLVTDELLTPHVKIYKDNFPPSTARPPPPPPAPVRGRPIKW